MLKLLEVLEEGAAESDRSALERLEASLSEAKRCPPTQEAVAAALDQGWSLYLASAWGDATVGQPVRSFDEIPAADRFTHRLVAFPPQSDAAPSKGGELIAAMQFRRPMPFPRSANTARNETLSTTCV